MEKFPSHSGNNSFIAMGFIESTHNTKSFVLLLWQLVMVHLVLQSGM